MTYQKFKTMYDALESFMLNEEWMFSNTDLIARSLHVTIDQATLIRKNYDDYSRDRLNQEIFILHIIYMRFPNEVYINENGDKLVVNKPCGKEGTKRRFINCKKDEGIRQLYKHMKSGFYD